MDTHWLPMPQVHGARLTGGGFGGAAMALTGPEFGAAQARQVAVEYARRFWPPARGIEPGHGPRRGTRYEPKNDQTVLPQICADRCGPDAD